MSKVSTCTADLVGKNRRRRSADSEGRELALAPFAGDAPPPQEPEQPEPELPAPPATIALCWQFRGARLGIQLIAPDRREIEEFSAAVQKLLLTVTNTDGTPLLSLDRLLVSLLLPYPDDHTPRDVPSEAPRLHHESISSQLQQAGMSSRQIETLGALDPRPFKRHQFEDEDDADEKRRWEAGIDELLYDPKTGDCHRIVDFLDDDFADHYDDNADDDADNSADGFDHSFQTATGGAPYYCQDFFDIERNLIARLRFFLFDHWLIETTDVRFDLLLLLPSPAVESKRRLFLTLTGAEQSAARRSG